MQLGSCPDFDMSSDACCSVEGEHPVFVEKAPGGDADETQLRPVILETLLNLENSQGGAVVVVVLFSPIRTLAACRHRAVVAPALRIT